jgi:GAF domain-containing protein
VALTGAGLRGLAEEQEALRRVATLVARGVPPEEVFASVTEELARLLLAEIANLVRFESDGTFTMLASEGGFPVGSRWQIGGKNPTTTIFETGRPARSDDYADHATGPQVGIAREAGLRSTVGVPIIVEGRLWGAIGVGSNREATLPPDTEARLGSFTELVATAIANADSREALRRIADEQAALRRVATLVAQSVPPEELFAAVAEEIVHVLPVRGARIGRYESDGTVTCVATITEPGAGEALGASPLILIGRRLPLGGNNLATVVFETGRPARLEYADASGPIVGGISEFGAGSGVGTPIVVDGRLWGLATAGSTVERPLPSDTEARLTGFTELLATAIANAESRAGLARLAEEQAALRRVATLVARGTSPQELFAAVVDEVGRVFSVENVGLARYESDGTMTTLAISERLAESLPVGGQWPLGGHNVSTVVSETGRSARIDRYGDASGRLGVTMREQGFASAVGAPIVVEGHLWGLMTLASTEQLLPTDAEERLVSFTELAAAAIANTESRAGLARLAEEQAALRRVATLVAEGAPPTAVFDAVVAEMAALLVADGITLVRYEPNDELTVLAHRGPGAPQVPPGTRVRHDGASVSATVRRTQRPARMASYADTEGHIGEVIGGLSFRSGVGAPIVVDGRLWGATIANWTAEEPPPSGTEERIAKFTRLLDTAIANADSRDQLTASRARLVTEAHEARRHVVRDLHDGAQQGLVHTIIALKLAHRALGKGEQDMAPLVSEALEYAEAANDELRELVHGILPSVLTREGLRAGVEELAGRMSIPVEIDIAVDRLPAVVEATAYFVVAGALTNVVKHAHAEHAEVRALVKDETLHLEVRDDGVGGADPRGPGVVGLSDRVTALDGRLGVESPAQGGTILAATLPLDPK